MEINKGSMLALASAALIATSLVGAPANAGTDKAAKRKAVIDYWTPERRAAAQPRDLVVDQRGLGYLRRADGSLQPYAHRVEAQNEAGPVPRAKPGGGSDNEAPQISGMDPDSSEIGAEYTFSAVVTDNVGLKSVKFVITKDGGLPQSFTPTDSGNDTYTVSLSGFTNGNWSWEVEARDTAKGRGNSASASATFTVNTAGGGGGGGGGGDAVTNAQWTGGGDIQLATGRLFYEMPSNPRRKRWSGYVCSGTVVSGGDGDRSIILTASHCVYDDANKSFARNVLFIPDQQNTNGSGTDSNCANDPLGCWVADFGVVDVNWTTRTFPDNVAWDYAFYVVDDNDPSAHSAGYADLGAVLDAVVAPFSIDFTTPSADDGSPGAGTPDFTHGMGYSYSDDPNFMYCAEDMQDMDAANWWLPSCDLSGGSSGGPWLQPFDGSATASPVISVNSWGYTTSPGMAGPKMDGSTSAQCVYDAAITAQFPQNPADGDAGYDVTCP